MATTLVFKFFFASVPVIMAGEECVVLERVEVKSLKMVFPGFTPQRKTTQ